MPPTASMRTSTSVGPGASSVMRSIETGAPTSRKTAASESIVHDASAKPVGARIISGSRVGHAGIMAPIGFSARCAAETGCPNYRQKQKSIGRTRKDEVWLWVYPRHECCDTGAYRDASSPETGHCRMEVTKHYRVGRRSAA